MYLNDYIRRFKLKNKNYIINYFKLWITFLIGITIFCGTILLSIVIQEKKYITLFLVNFILFIIIMYFGYMVVYRKYKDIDKIFRLYVEGYLGEDLFQKNIGISPNLDKVLKILGEKLDKTKILNLSKKQAQYLALQNQINPHFLYNTLEGIRSEALCAGIDEVASMTEALATFFRYTISNLDHLVTLDDELRNIENYYIIQKYRFGDKLNLTIEYDEDADLSVLNFRLPKLILQPIVENAIYHGIEQKIGQGIIKIRIDYTKERLIIKVSDDGLGIDKDLLTQLNSKLMTTSLDDITEPMKDQRGGIAIINVNNRIKLLFGEKFGIHIQSTKNIGTDVELTLPIVYQ